MHIKFLRHGTGSAAKAAAYVLAELDHLGIKRADVQVRRGNPEQVAAVADGLPFVQRYSSAVIAWAKEDVPTPEQIEQTLNEFEQLAFAGIEADRISWTAVQHTEQNGAVHVHILVAKVDLATGKAFNPAPPGWQKDFDPLRDALNLEHGWARPDDPARARLLQQGHQALIDAATLRQRLQPASAKEQITDWLAKRIEAGQVSDRAGIRASLAEIGEITREGKDYVSVKPPGFDKALRFKGAIYGEEWKRDAAVSLDPAEGRSRPAADRAANERAVQAARRELEEVIRRRAEFNCQRYRESQQGRQVDAQRAGATDQTAEPEHKSGSDGSAGSSDTAATLGATLAATGDGSTLPSYLRADLGLLESGHALGDRDHEQRQAVQGNERRLDDLQHTRAQALPVGRLEEDSDGKNDKNKHGGRAGSHASTATARFEPWRSGGQDSDVLRTSRKAQPERLPTLRDGNAGHEQQAGGNALLLRLVSGFGRVHHGLHVLYTSLRGFYDRVRAAVVGRSRSILSTVFQRRVDLVTANARLVAATGQLDRDTEQAHGSQRGAVQSCGQAVERFQRSTGKFMNHSKDELESFKSQINLAEYAQACGYQIDKKESSRQSVVMRNGDDKIVVATAQDGHGIYFSVRDEKDNGTIVDFVQKRQGANLGQVRKELRPWVGGAPSSYRPNQPEAERPRKPEPSSADRLRVLVVWSRMAEQTPGSYLTATRGIAQRVLDDPRFNGMVRHTPDGKVLFPHFDQAGLAGYEIRAEPTADHSGKGFAKGGEKALWHSSNIGHARRVVTVESAIDALSHAQLSKDANVAYISVGGAMSDKQRKLLAQHLDDAHRRGASLCIGTDADQAGDKLAGELQLLAPRGARLERQRPDQGKDWNDKLRMELVEQGKRRQAALDLIEKLRCTQLFNSAWAKSNEEIMRLAFERYWQRMNREKRQALIEAAKLCRNAEELRAFSRDPTAAATLAAQGDLLTQIEQEIEERGEPGECSVWADVSGKAHGLAKERHHGDPLVDALAQASGVQPEQAKQEFDKQKFAEAEMKEAMIKAQQRINEAAAAGKPPDPADIKCLAECTAGLGMSGGKIKLPEKSMSLSM